MQLTTVQCEQVVEIALTYLNQPYRKGFRCVEFVREVYCQIGIHLPILQSWAPPQGFNIFKEQLIDPPAGHVMFLRDRDDPRKERSWTHVVILISKLNCIHCSLFSGEKVVISTLEEIYKRYDFAESN